MNSNGKMLFYAIGKLPGNASGETFVQYFNVISRHNNGVIKLDIIINVAKEGVLFILSNEMIFMYPYNFKLHNNNHC